MANTERSLDDIYLKINNISGSAKAGNSIAKNDLLFFNMQDGQVYSANQSIVDSYPVLDSYQQIANNTDPSKHLKEYFILGIALSDANKDDDVQFDKLSMTWSGNDGEGVTVTYSGMGENDNESNYVGGRAFINGTKNITVYKPEGDIKSDSTYNVPEGYFIGNAVRCNNNKAIILLDKGHITDNFKFEKSLTYLFDSIFRVSKSFNGNTVTFENLNSNGKALNVIGNTTIRNLESDPTGVLVVNSKGISLTGFTHIRSSINNPNGVIHVDSSGIELEAATDKKISLKGVTTLSSTLNVTGNFSININKFNVEASTGNTSIHGNLYILNNSGFRLSFINSSENNLSSVYFSSSQFFITNNELNTIFEVIPKDDVNNSTTKIKKGSFEVSSGATILKSTLKVHGETNLLDKLKVLNNIDSSSLTTGSATLSFFLKVGANINEVYNEVFNVSPSIENINNSTTQVLKGSFEVINCTTKLIGITTIADSNSSSTNGKIKVDSSGIKLSVGNNKNITLQGFASLPSSSSNEKYFIKIDKNGYLSVDTNKYATETYVQNAIQDAVNKAWTVTSYPQP